MVVGREACRRWNLATAVLLDRAQRAIEFPLLPFSPDRVGDQSRGEEALYWKNISSNEERGKTTREGELINTQRGRERASDPPARVSRRARAQSSAEANRQVR